MIAIVAPNYDPETNAAAKRITSIAQRMSGRHKVTVVTHLPHYPQNRIYEGYDVTSPDVREESGVEVVRLRPWLVPKASLPLRMAAETLFCIQASAHVLSRRPDLVLTSSPFMFLGPMGLLVSRVLGAAFVWDVRDLTWLYPRATGHRTYGTDRLLERLMLITARHSDALTTATDGLLGYFRDRPDRSMVVVNGVNDELLDELLDLPPAEPPDEPRALYAGLFGYNHALKTVLQAAELLPHVHFTLAGDGPDKAELIAFTKSRGLANVSFSGYLSKDELIGQYRRSTVLISHVRRNPLYRWTQPAKLWEYMATGRPVIHAGEGEAVDIVTRYDIGVAIPPQDAGALAAGIRMVLEAPEEARALGRRARAFVDTYRRRTKLLEDLESVLEDTIAAKRGVARRHTSHTLP